MIRTHLDRRSLLARTLGMGVAAFMAARPAWGRAQASTPVATPAEITTPAVDRLTWLLDRLTPGTLTADEVAEHFAPAYLTAIPSMTIAPPDEVINRVQYLGEQLGSVSMEGFASPPELTPGAVYAILAAGADVYVMILTVEPEPPHRILDVLTSPVRVELVRSPPPPPATWEELDRFLLSYTSEASVLAAELVSGEIRPIHALNPDRPLAIGSTFKLYVLGELAARIDAGRAAWDDMLAIRNEWKSLPADPLADTMAYEPAGTEHTLADYAAHMIAVSGNTATDHLVLHLGRNQVETRLETMGNEHAARNSPLLATREVFALDLVLPPDQVAAYIEASDTEQRALLDATVRAVDVAPVFQLVWLEPRHLETVGWYASTRDLCRAMAALRTMADRPNLEPVLEILALQPGIDPTVINAGQAWTYIGHKGGALPGGVNGTWLLERSDGRQFALAVTLNSPIEPLDLLTPDFAFAGAISLLERADGSPATPGATPVG